MTYPACYLASAGRSSDVQTLAVCNVSTKYDNLIAVILIFLKIRLLEYLCTFTVYSRSCLYIHTPILIIYYVISPVLMHNCDRNLLALSSAILSTSCLSSHTFIFQFHSVSYVLFAIPTVNPDVRFSSLAYSDVRTSCSY